MFKCERSILIYFMILIYLVYVRSIGTNGYISRRHVSWSNMDRRRYEQYVVSATHRCHGDMRITDWWMDNRAKQWDMIPRDTPPNLYFTPWRIGYVCQASSPDPGMGTEAANFRRATGQAVGVHCFCRAFHWRPCWGTMTERRAHCLRELAAYWRERRWKASILLYNVIPPELCSHVMSFAAH
jgi:hypothetical protein